MLLPSAKIAYISEKWLLCENHTGPMAVWNPLIGAVYFSIGSICSILYIPCLIVIKRHPLFAHSAFKILFVMGILDICNLSCSGIFAGFCSMTGGTFCDYPIAMLIFGHMTLDCWCTYTALCVLLGINRCMDIYSASVMKKWFTPAKTWLCIALPFIYGLYFLVCEPCAFYNTQLKAWFFDFDPMRQQQIRSIMHMFNNLGGSVLITILYAILMAMLYRAQVRVTKCQVRLTLQSVAICSFIIVSCTLYSLMQFIQFPLEFAVVAQITWQMVNSVGVFIYLCFNKTIYEGVLTLIGMKSLVAGAKVKPVPKNATNSALVPLP